MTASSPDSASPLPVTSLASPLGRALLPYLQVGIWSLAALGLLSGWAGSLWQLVLALFVILSLANLVLWQSARRLGSPLIFAIVNAPLCAAVVLITGGAASHFWVLFFIFVVSAALLSGIAAYALVGGLALVLASSQMVSGPTWPAFTDIGIRILILLFAALVVQAARLILRPVRTPDDVERQNMDVRLASVLNTVADAIIAVDETQCVVLFNRGAAQIFGYAPEEILGQPFERLVPPFFTNMHAHIRALATTAETPPVSGELWEVIGQCRDGRKFPAEALITKLSQHQQTLIVISLHDVSEKEQAAAALQQANEKLTVWVSELEQANRESTLLNAMGDLLQGCHSVEEAYAVIAQTLPYMFAAEYGAVGMLNAARSQVEMVAAWRKTPDEQEAYAFAPDACWALQRGKLILVNPDHPGPVCSHVGQLPEGGYMCVPLMAQNEALGVLHLRYLPEDGSQLERKQQVAVMVAEHLALAIANLRLRETLRLQSIRDPLTGLYNRRYMEEAFERELHRAQRGQLPLSVIMLDIDHFKRFNDTFGHAAGDLMLRELGAFLQTRIRSSDIACRYGGEEFTLILPEASLEDTQRRAEQIRDGIKLRVVQFQDQPLGPITLSLGVATFPDHGTTLATLLQAADIALYRAKRAGRDRVVLASLPVEHAV